MKNTVGLIRENVAIDQGKTMQMKQHIVYCVDISGSMSSDIGNVRNDLKNHFATNDREDFYISVIAFSGKNECYKVLESFRIGDLKDLSAAQNAVDKYLKPMCLTAFLPPLKAVSDIVSKKSDDVLYSMIFMTDGYNNDSPFEEVLKVCDDLESRLSSSAFIEYGYYADTKALSEMAQRIGGQQVVARDFQQYKSDFDNLLNQNTEVRRALFLEHKEKLKYPFVYYINSNDDIIIQSTKYKKEILVPMSLQTLYYFSNDAQQDIDYADDAYLAAYVLAAQGKYFDVEKILAVLGDVYLLDILMGSYGKQALDTFKQMLKDAWKDKRYRYIDGQDTSYVPNENAYCLMDIISDLQNDPDARFYPNFDGWEYNRISAKMEQVKPVDAGVSGERLFPEFMIKKDQSGYPLSDLVYNKDRANISIRVRYTGEVLLPRNEFHINSVPSHIWRNYTILQDGIRNIDWIAVDISDRLVEKFRKKGVLSQCEKTGKYILRFDAVPIINKKMVSSISAKVLAEKEYALIEVQAAAKFLKPVLKEVSNDLGGGYYSDDYRKYSPDFIAYINSLGISENNGFNPKVVKAETSDTYVANKLEVKISSLSSIPKAADVVKKINEGKKALTVSESMMQREMDKYNSYIDAATHERMSPDARERIAGPLTKVYFDDINNIRKGILDEIAKIKFALIMSRGWFKEFTSMEENSMEMRFNDHPHTVKFEYTEELIEI